MAEDLQPWKRCSAQSSRDNAHGFIQLDINQFSVR